MIILPSIDIKDSKVVRLYRGDFATAHQVAHDPIQTAQAFEAAGATYLHMVDLDGAKLGQRVNGGLVQSIIAQTKLRVELGGGIRNMEDIRAVDAVGVYRMVIGSAAVTNQNFVREAIKQYGERIAIGIDAQNGMVKTAGWTQSTELDYLTFAQSMEEIGVKYIVFTDIDTDGMLSGPHYPRLEALQRAVSCHIIASGGITTIDDIKHLRDMGLYGAIIGKAYYAGTVDLAEAVKEAGGPC